MRRSGRGAPVPGSERGLTLIEVIVVVAIVGVLLSVSAAALGPRLLQPSSAAGAVDEALRDARVEAARGGGSVRLEVAGDGAYTVTRVRDLEVLARGRIDVDAVDSAPFRTIFLPAGTSLGGLLRVRWRGEWSEMRVDRVTARARPPS